MKAFLLAISFAGVVFTSPSPAPAQWTQSFGGPQGQIVSSLASEFQTLYAGTGGPGNPFLFISTNQGSSWFISDSTILAVNSFAVRDSIVFAGTGGGSGIYRSTNSGLNWSPANSGLTNTNVNVIVANNSMLFAGTWGGGVFRSTDNGASWNEANTGLTNPIVLSMTFNGSYVFAGTYGGGVFVSNNNGVDWTAANVGLTNLTVNDLASNVIAAFAGTPGGGVFRTPNNGPNWTQINSGLTDSSVSVFSVIGTNVFVGTPSGVFVSTNNGDSWIDVSSGLPANYSILSLAFDSTYMYAGLYYGGVWRRPRSEMITAVERPPTNLPTHFSLDQNYPNPFNPATTISFSLPSRAFTSLKVFDALGREVSLVLTEELPAGTYSRKWDAADLASGMYFYRLQTGSFTETKKLILLK